MRPARILTAVFGAVVLLFALCAAGFAAYIPSDPGFPNQWGLSNTGQEIVGVTGTPGADISATRAWDIERGSTNPVTVAVIDSGTEFTHPDLASKIWRNPGEIPANQIDDDDNGYVDDVNGYNFVGISQTCFYYQSGGSIAFSSAKFGTGPGSKKFAQSITGTGQNLTHAGFLLDKVGNPADGITLSVRTSLDSPVISSLTISPSEVSTSMAKVYKQLSASLTIDSGSFYCLVLETANEDASNYRIRARKPLISIRG